MEEGQYLINTFEEINETHLQDASIPIYIQLLEKMYHINNNP